MREAPNKEMSQEPILYDKDTIVEEELLNLCSRLTRIHAMASHPTHTVKFRIAEKNMLPRRVTKSPNNHEKPQIEPPSTNPDILQTPVGRLQTLVGRLQTPVGRPDIYILQEQTAGHQELHQNKEWWL
jgi:hypothetical protein